MKHTNFKTKLLNYIPFNQWITYDLLCVYIEERYNIYYDIIDKICYELIQEKIIEESKVQSLGYDEIGVATHTMYKKLKNIN